MKPEVALETREQMLRDGYCVIPDILSQDFLQELRQESDPLNDTMIYHVFELQLYYYNFLQMDLKPIDFYYYLYLSN